MASSRGVSKVLANAKLPPMNNAVATSVFFIEASGVGRRAPELPVRQFSVVRLTRQTLPRLHDREKETRAEKGIGRWRPSRAIILGHAMGNPPV